MLQHSYPEFSLSVRSSCRAGAELPAPLRVRTSRPRSDGPRSQPGDTGTHSPTRHRDAPAGRHYANVGTKPSLLPKLRILDDACHAAYEALPILLLFNQLGSATRRDGI